MSKKLDKATLDSWNNILAYKYGKNYDNRPKWRLAWTSDLFEMRRGEYDIYYGDSDIFLRQDVGIYEVPKYNYAMDRYVLEALTVFPNTPADLVNTSPLAYNPVWIFWDTKTKKLDKDGNYAATEPSLEQIDQIIYFARNKRLKGHGPTEEQLIAKRKEELRTKLDEAVPTSVHSLVHGHAVFMDSSKQKGIENGDSILVKP